MEMEGTPRKGTHPVPPQNQISPSSRRRHVPGGHRDAGRSAGSGEGFAAEEPGDEALVPDPGLAPKPKNLKF